LRTFAVTWNERRAIAERGNPVAFNGNHHKKMYESYGVSPLRNGAALIPRHGKGAQKPADRIVNKTFVAVSRYSERAERRASMRAQFRRGQRSGLYSNNPHTKVCTGTRQKIIYIFERKHGFTNRVLNPQP
jgi:hypothetical protein